MDSPDAPLCSLIRDASTVLPDAALLDVMRILEVPSTSADTPRCAPAGAPQGVSWAAGVESMHRALCEVAASRVPSAQAPAGFSPASEDLDPLDVLRLALCPTEPVTPERGSVDLASTPPPEASVAPTRAADTPDTDTPTGYDHSPFGVHRDKAHGALELTVPTTTWIVDHEDAPTPASPEATPAAARIRTVPASPIAVPGRPRTPLRPEELISRDGGELPLPVLGSASALVCSVPAAQGCPGLSYALELHQDEEWGVEHFLRALRSGEDDPRIRTDKARACVRIAEDCTALVISTRPLPARWSWGDALPSLGVSYAEAFQERLDHVQGADGFADMASPEELRARASWAGVSPVPDDDGALRAVMRCWPDPRLRAARPECWPGFFRSAQTLVLRAEDGITAHMITRLGEAAQEGHLALGFGEVGFFAGLQLWETTS